MGAPPLAPETRRAIYRGAQVTAGAAALSDILKHAAHMIANGFFDLDPLRAHTTLPLDDYRTRVVALRQGFARDSAVRSLVEKLIAEWGADPGDAYLDTLKLRIAPPGGTGMPYPLAPLKAHRDTWGSNIMQQINVWAPIMPLALGRTLALWPDQFDQPVENDSADWDLNDLRRRRADGTLDAYPLMPTAIHAPSLGSAKRVMPDVGDAVIFSGAHLHASVPNHSALARLNVELRIVFLADRNAGEGAPNVDGRAPCTPLQWFASLDGQRSLEDATPPLALT